jgi:hypothetical protein
MDSIVVVRGKVDVRNEKVSIICDSVQAYEEGAGEAAAPATADDGWGGPPPEMEEADVAPVSEPVAPRRESHGDGARSALNREQPARTGWAGGKRRQAEERPARHHVRIVVPYTDEESGMRRLGDLRDVLGRYPGEDRISLWLQSGLARVKMSTTVTAHYCQGLASDLTAILGEGNLQVEQI